MRRLRHPLTRKIVIVILALTFLGAALLAMLPKESHSGTITSVTSVQSNGCSNAEALAP